MQFGYYNTIKEKRWNTEKDVTNFNMFSGYQVMASNLLYKTKSGGDLDNEMGERSNGESGKKTHFTASKLGHNKLSVEDEGQFAADFQQQHHHHRWGKGIITQQYI